MGLISLSCHVQNPLFSFEAVVPRTKLLDSFDEFCFTPRPTMSIPDLAVMAAAVVGSADPEIVACEARIRAAQLTADVAALDDLIAEDLLFAGPNGELGSKAQDLEAHGSGVVRFQRHEPGELRVRMVGANVAVSSLRAKLAVEVAGTLHQGTYRYTRVWAREGGMPWRVVGGQVSRLPDSEDQPPHGE